MSLIKKLHKFSFLRKIVRAYIPKITIRQKFHNGIICLDAKEHSWAWTGENTYETFDRNVQDTIYDLSLENDIFIDIGANIGVMTLNTLLRNKTISTVSIEPNPRALELLKKSIKQNNFEARTEVVEAAMGTKEGFVFFDEGRSVTGHIVEKSSQKVKIIEFSKFLNDFLIDKKCLVKIDIEGYETEILTLLPLIKNKENLTIILEIHPLNYCKMGNPEEVVNLLEQANGLVTDFKGKKIKNLTSYDVHNVIVTF